MAKKRANGEGSIRRKPNGRWEGRYTQGIDPSTGRAIQKSVSARTQAECKEKLAKAIRDNRGIPVNHNEDYTVAEWCRLWFETYSKPVIRPNTAKTYENMIENHIVPAIGGIKLKRLTAIQIQKMYNDSKTKGRVQRFEKKIDTALSGSTVRRIHMVLSSALKQAVKERIIPYNPCNNCRIPPKEKKEMAIIPPEKLGVYLSEAEKYGVLPMFFLELSSGLRRGELLALRWDDLNVRDRILSVSKQVTRIDGELVITEPKTKNSVRKVALSQQAVALLVRERMRAGDPAFQEFLDLFHNRLLHLWRDMASSLCPELRADGPSEAHPFAAFLEAVSGLPNTGERARGVPMPGPVAGRGDVPAALFRSCAAVWARQPRSAAGLEKLVKAAFGVEARVEPFRGAWIDLPEEDLTRLGGRDAGNARLGSTALLGSRVFDASAGITLRLGPLTEAQRRMFLPPPAGTCRADLLALVRWYLGDMGCEIVLERQGGTGRKYGC